MIVPLAPSNSPRIASTIPAIASPLPPCMGFSLICERPRHEKIRPMTEIGGPKQQQQKPKSPARLVANPAIAIPLVRVEEPLPAAIIGKGAGAVTASSGKELIGRQLSPPSGLSWDSALTRPSAIHRRKSIAETGPYSFPSAPRTLYMQVVIVVVTSAG